MKRWFASKEAKKITGIILILFAALLMQIMGFSNFNDKLYEMSLEHSMEQVEELSVYVEKNLHLEIERYIHILRVVEAQMEKVDEDFPEEMVQKLKTAQEGSNFRKMGVSNLNGKGVDSDGERYDIFYEHIREDIENDRVFISNVFKNDGETLIFLAVPLKLDEEICGIVWGKYGLADLIDSIEFVDNKYKYFQIIDDQGNYLYCSNNAYASGSDAGYSGETIWEELSKYTYTDGMSAEEIYHKVQNRESGIFYFSGDRQGRYVSYRPLKINNWYLFSTQVEDELHTYVHRTRQTALNLFVVLVIGLLIIFGSIYNLIYTMYKKMAKQNHEVQAINLMLQAILKKIKNIPFAIDYQEKQVSFYGYSFEEVVKRCSFADLHPEKMLENGRLDKESLEAYTTLYHSLILRQESCAPAIIYAQVGGNKEWLRVSIISDGQNSTNQIIGVLENYGEQKGKDLQIETHLDDIKKIEEKSQIDFLTGLYNREAFLEKVCVLLEENEKNQQTGALMIMDLDHFKDVNDRMGHGMGDVVLQETANILRSFFRKEDVVGRLGGDEFVIFAQNICDVQAFESRINELNRLLYRKYHKDGQSAQVSASIGVVITDKGDHTFNTLYEKADQALYKVKEASRNGYCIYSRDA